MTTDTTNHESAENLTLDKCDLDVVRVSVRRWIPNDIEHVSRIIADYLTNGRKLGAWRGVRDAVLEARKWN